MNFLQDIFGSKPTVPAWKPLNLGSEQGAAIANNQQNLQSAEQLTANANAFSQQQIQQMLNNAIPGFSQLTGNVQSTINSEIAGELPADVQQRIQSSTAANAFAGGYAGSDLARNLTARDLGITSLNLTQQGLSSAQSWIQQMNNLFSPGMLNVSGMFVTPGQQAAFDVQQQQQQFQQQWMQNQINAMPDPVLSGINTQITNLVGAYLSKGGGGGQYAAQYGANDVSGSGMDFGGGGSGFGSMAVGYGSGAQVGFDESQSQIDYAGTLA